MYTQRKEPCPQCPYVRTTPSGIWHQTEYEKLPKYDPQKIDVNDELFELNLDTSVFHCHHTNDQKDIICQGWLDCHGADQLLGIRMAHFRGKLPDNFDYEPSGADVYATGKEAMDHGTKEIEKPGREASVPEGLAEPVDSAGVTDTSLTAVSLAPVR